MPSGAHTAQSYTPEDHQKARALARIYAGDKWFAGETSEPRLDWFVQCIAASLAIERHRSAPSSMPSDACCVVFPCVKRRKHDGPCIPATDRAGHSSMPGAASEYRCRHCSLVREIPSFADDPCSNGAPHNWCHRYKAEPSSGLASRMVSLDAVLRWLATSAATLDEHAQDDASVYRRIGPELEGAYVDGDLVEKKA